MHIYIFRLYYFFSNLSINFFGHNNTFFSSYKFLFETEDILHLMRLVAHE